MIPAILSVIFVVYLYQKLNHPPESPPADIADSRSDDPTEDLMNRLRAIQLRIEQISQGGENGGRNR